MSYRVELAPAARRDLDRIPDQAFERLDPLIQALSEDPRPPGATSVRGFPRHCKFRCGDYRVAYEVNDTSRVVTIKAVGHRREIYQTLRRRL